MKNLLRFLGMLLCLLTALPSFAEEDRLQSLISQAEAAIARNDDEERIRIVDEIFVLTTGLDVKLENFPDSLSAEEYEKRIGALEVSDGVDQGTVREFSDAPLRWFLVAHVIEIPLRR